MAKDVYKNDLISATPFTDLGGETAVKAHGGERRLGSTAAFLGVQSINIDGSTTSYPALNEVISTQLICGVCGVPVGKKKKMVKQNGVLRCPRCLDEE